MLAILPLLFVHESRALRYVGNKIFFQFASVRLHLAKSLSLTEQDMSALVIGLACLYSIYGWSIAHRAFEFAGTDVHLGVAVCCHMPEGYGSREDVAGSDRRAVRGPVSADDLARMSSYSSLVFVGWPADAWDGSRTVANGGGGRGLPAPSDGYYHYKRTTREVVPRY